MNKELGQPTNQPAREREREREREIYYIIMILETFELMQYNGMFIDRKFNIKKK